MADADTATNTVNGTTVTQNADVAPQRRRSRRKSGLSDAQRSWILAITIMGVMLGLGTTDADPTGHDLIDTIYLTVFIVMTTLAGARARRWSLVIASGLALIGTTTYMMIPPAAAFAIAAVLAWQNRRDRVLGALVGALVGVSVLNLVWPLTTGFTAVLAAAAVLPMFVSGYRVARSHNRRRIRMGLLIALVVVIVGSAAAGLAVLQQRKVLTTAASTTIDATNSLTAETTDEATKQFVDASRRFDSAAAATDAIWTYPAKLVPIVAQNLDAVHQAAAAGADVTRTAAEITDSVDYDRLQRDGGGLDLEVLKSFEPVIERAEGVIKSVDDTVRSLDSPWLLSALTDPLDEFAEQTGTLRQGAELASLVVNDVPSLLGGDGERRYLLLLGNPAEARDIGGHIGTFAELSAIDGVLRVVRTATPYQLFGPSGVGGPELTDRSVLPAAMLEMNPTRFAQNWGSSPDLRAVAEVSRQLYPQTAGGSEIDGILYADPYAFSAVLKVVGDIDITMDSPLGPIPFKATAANAVKFLTRDQFVIGEGGDDSVGDLVDTALDRLTGQRLPSVRKIIDAFGPAIEQGRLQMFTFHDGDSELLTRSGLDQPFTRAVGGDLFAVISRNGYPSKIDSYVSRKIDYRPVWNPRTGAVDAQVRIELSNAAPTEGLPELISLSPAGTAPGTSRTVLSVVTAFEAVDATLDGEILPIGTRPEQENLRRHTVLVDIAPGATRTIVLNLRGSVKPGPNYNLKVYGQPLVNADTMDVSITSTGAPFIGGVKAGRVTISHGAAGSKDAESDDAKGSENAEVGKETLESGARRITDLRFRTDS